MKPHSSISPQKTMGVFKGFSSRALIICLKKYLDKETEFLIHVFVENGHYIKIFEKVTNEYVNNKTCVKENKNIKTNKNEKTVSLPWIPIPEAKLRKEFRNFGIKTTFTSGPNLKKLDKYKYFEISLQVYINYSLRPKWI